MNKIINAILKCIYIFPLFVCFSFFWSILFVCYICYAGDVSRFEDAAAGFHISANRVNVRYSSRLGKMT